MKTPRIVRPKNWDTKIEDRERKTEYIECLECGKKLKQINWVHLKKHELTPDQYRKKHEIPYSDGMCILSTSKKRSENAKKNIRLGITKLIKPFDPNFKGGYKKTGRKSPAFRKKIEAQRETMKKKYQENKQFRKRLLKNFEKGWKASAESCFVCNHKDRKKIEMLIKNYSKGDSKIADIFGLLRGSIQRHRINCMKIGRKNQMRPFSTRTIGKCIICKKEFVYYRYDRRKYGVKNYKRKYCSNKCKGIGMTKL